MSSLRKGLRRLGSEFGLTTVARAPVDVRRDVILLYTIRACRLFGYGLTVSVLVLHARQNLGWTDLFVGTFISTTLLGNALLALIVTNSARKISQKRMVAIGPAFMILAGIIFYFSSSPPLLLLAASIGVISPIANEVSPYQAVDIAVLSQLVHEDARTPMFTSYMFVGAISSSIGGVLSGNIIYRLTPDIGQNKAYRTVFLVFALAGFISSLCALWLSDKVNLPIDGDKEPLPTPVIDETAPLLPDQPTLPSTKAEQAKEAIIPRFGVPVVIILSIVSGLDTFASSIASPSYISFDLNERFHPPIRTITSTLSLCGLLAGASFLFSGVLSRRIGQLTTMFTSHIIAQAFLISYALATRLHISIILILLRACFAVLELPARTAFFTSIIKLEERTRVLGYVNLARTLLAAAGPTVDGFLAARGLIKYAFVSSAIIKLFAYDFGLSLFFAFRGRRPRSTD